VLRLGLVERVLELAVGRDGGVVEHRAGGDGDADAALGPRLGRGEPRMAMDTEPWSPAPARSRHDDRDETRDAATQVPERGGGRVPERCARAAREHRCHPPPVGAEDRMADRVHAGVDPVQSTRLESAVDRVASEPELEQLPARDRAVLLLGQVGKRLLDESSPHSGVSRRAAGMSAA
jgi:hypothetical protein